MFGIQAILDAMNQLLGDIYQLSWHIIKDNSLWPQELPGNHMQCNKTNVEIQILYLNASGSHI